MAVYTGRSHIVVKTKDSNVNSQYFGWPYLQTAESSISARTVYSAARSETRYRSRIQICINIIYRVYPEPRFMSGNPDIVDITVNMCLQLAGGRCKVVMLPSVDGIAHAKGAGGWKHTASVVESR